MTSPHPARPEADRFDVLASLIETYEATHWPIEAPDPVTASCACMERFGYTQTGLANLLGSRSRASAILSGRRALTMEQACRLHRDWHIPAEALLRPASAR